MMMILDTDLLLFLQVQLGTIIATLVRELTWTLDQPFPGNDYTVCLRRSPGLCFNSLITDNWHFFIIDYDRHASQPSQRLVQAQGDYKGLNTLSQLATPHHLFSRLSPGLSFSLIDISVVFFSDSRRPLAPRWFVNGLICVSDSSRSNGLFPLPPVHLPLFSAPLCEALCDAGKGETIHRKACARLVPLSRKSKSFRFDPKCAPCEECQPRTLP